MTGRRSTALVYRCPMLEMRPVCENCGRELAADRLGARICSYECTFCDPCATDILGGVCPNCGGVLLVRPPRTTASTRRRDPNVFEVVVDCAAPARLAAFYGDLLGVEPVVRESGWAYVIPGEPGAGWLADGPPRRDGLRIAFQKVPEPKVGKVRIHLDFGSLDIAADTARATELGATVLSGPHTDDEGSFFVLADPEGNEFCLVSVELPFR